MAIELIEMVKNTRGVNSRAIKYMAIGKWVTKEVDRESKPDIDPATGKVKLDDKGNEIRIPLGKDKDGKLITIKEEVKEFVSDGVITDVSEALELCNNDEQMVWDCFADGYNERAYSTEANKDELDEFLADMNLNDEQKSAFKRTARQISRTVEGTELLDAAEMVKSMMLKARAKKEAAAAVA
jgi:hypothetical protein